MPFDKTFATHPHVKPARKRTKHVGRPIGNAAAARAAISVAVALADSGAILLAALAAGTIYHAAFYEAAGMWESHVAIGGVVAALFCVACVLRRDYEVPSLLSFKDNIPRLCALWSVAFLSLAILAFATKTGADVSRGTIFILYIFGLAAVLAERAIVARIVLDQASAGGVAARRVFLVGCEEDIARCAARFESPGSGVRVVSSAVLRGEDSLDDDLALAAAMARVLRPDDVYILVPWSRSHMVESAIDVFLRVPAALHLGPGRVLDRFPKARLEPVGPVVSVNLDRQPLGLLDFAVKRALDIVVAGAALVALSPVFAVVALLIKLESPGPVLFRQRRYGFNQEPFHIFKFRSMNTMEDGREVVQATVGDSRITRVGRFIRRTNIDELPQLLNVLVGDMSLVGPRPHAMVHDQMFERDIALYARRHNMRPGISGWAQVNGYRGETSTADKMRGRIEHDLQYIDRWSISLDLKIMFLTVFSGRAYRNAC